MIMPNLRGVAALSLLLLGAPAGPALAQAPVQPPVPAVTDGGEELDSGVGDLDTAEWIGKPVMSSDQRAVGTLREVRMAGATADGGLLMVDRDDGATAEIPMAGASFDGTNVVVTPVYGSIVAN